MFICKPEGRPKLDVLCAYMRGGEMERGRRETYSSVLCSYQVIHICIYIFVCVYIYIYMYTHTHIRIHARTQIAS